MCGIAGILNFDGSPVEETLLRQMNQVQRHRGPDDEGIYLDPNFPVGLGHRRLSIIDLSPAGHQPMSFGDRYWITYNGEIYNYLELRQELKQWGYQFRSHTDTEVILAAYTEWGSECLNRFNGMWAFAIWDTKERRLFCTRDRFGIKPFYYFWNERQFVFASEIKALIQYLRKSHRGEVVANDTTIADYLLGLRLDAGEETFFRNIHRLPAAHFLLLSDRQLQLRRYYSLAPTLQEQPENRSDAIAKFRELFTDAVRFRLRSDVPVGSCLSGGIDSSSIVCTVNRLLFTSEQPDQAAVANQQKTFSACYRDFPQYDERSYIRAVLAQTGAAENFVFPDGKELFTELEDFVWHHDEPVSSSSTYAQWCVFRAAHEQGMKVMLDGQGADETVSGYHGAYPPFFLDLIRRLHWRQFWQELALYRGYHGYSMMGTMKNIFASWFRSALPGVLYQPLASYYLQKQRHPFFMVQPSPTSVEERVPRVWRKRGALPEYLYRLTTGSSLQSLLRYEDRNSMAFSIEARVPFLDYRLVEFAFSLPEQYKVHNGLTKAFIREGMIGVIPEQVRSRVDKVGFATPEGQWLRTVGREMVQDTFASDSFANRGYFAADKVRAAFAELLARESDLPSSTYATFWRDVNPFWRAFNVEIWLRLFVDGGR